MLVWIKNTLTLAGIFEGVHLIRVFSPSLAISRGAPIQDYMEHLGWAGTSMSFGHYNVEPLYSSMMGSLVQ